jgi:nucleoside-diphosphate-sugar epimerase
VVGDITDTDWLTAQLSGVDGAIHTASPGDASSAAVDDLAALYLLVLQAGRRLGSVVGVTADTPTVRELAEATGSPVAPEAVDATRARLGEAFADALLLDQQFDDGYARSLGWTPTAPTLAEELRSGSYAS